MAEIRFPSLAAPKERAYIYDNVNYHRSPAVDGYLLFYETYGDGMCQHSPAFLIGVPLFEDYCYSLTAHLLDHPHQHSLIGPHFSTPVSDKDIAFAASVAYKLGKDRWYSVEERNVGVSDKLRHDRRYQAVESWMDGSPAAVLRLLSNDFYSNLQTFILNHAVRAWFDRNAESSGEWPTLEREASYNDRQRWFHALETVQGVCQALDALRVHRHNVENYQRSSERRRRQGTAPVPEGV